MPVRFAFLTDTHHYPDAPENYGAPKMLTRSKEVLDAIPPAINALNPDFAVHGGDFLCGGGSFDLPTDTYLRSIDEAATTLDRIEAPFYSIPGNHDCDAQTGSFDGFAARFPLPEPLSVVDAAPRLRLALANVFFECDVFAQGSGVWSDALDQSLRSAADQALADRCALLLFLHTWVLPDYEGKGGLVENAERLRNTLDHCPAIVAVFTGHRHINRITAHRDYLVVDTACLIGYPLGFREITLSENGYFTTHFHALDLAQLIEDSYDRSTLEQNRVWQGEIYDRENEILVPRLKEIWS